jgi:hypothetical protein
MFVRWQSREAKGREEIHWRAILVEGVGKSGLFRALKNGAVDLSAAPRRLGGLAIQISLPASATGAVQKVGASVADVVSA